MPHVKVFTRREDFLKSTLIPTVLELTDETEVLPHYSLCEYNAGPLKLYALSYQVNDSDAHFVMASMTIPAYFDQAPLIGNQKKEIQGIFLIDMGKDQQSLKDFFEDNKIFGNNGCPKRVLTTTNPSGLHSSDREYFTFNKMRFYPFILHDFTVGYYVCDGGLGGTNPQPSNALPTWSPAEFGVALDLPLHYDPTLGLYLTRGAHVVS